MNVVDAFENNVLKYLLTKFFRNKVFKGKLIHCDTIEIRVEQVCPGRIWNAAEHLR